MQTGLHSEISALLARFEDAPDDVTTQAFLNIRMALKIINAERQTLYDNGVLLSFHPSMSGSITVSLTPR